MLSSITTSDFTGASAGSGIHFFSGANLTLADNHISGVVGPPNNWALYFDPSGIFSNIIVNGNDLTGNATAPAVTYPPTITGLYLANNAGFNPVGPIPTPYPTQSCGATITNPYPYAVDVNLNDGSGTMSVTKGGQLVAPASTSYAEVYLGVGQSYTLSSCSATPPTALWFGR
jgi:hypothetical protein